MAAKKMLIDAAHPEETRVVVVDGNRLEDYDVEVASRRQLKGNIYLAKVTRVEPSLQAAFVDYGGNRHGFLAFNEIHPDYYQIPVADRERLLAEQAAAENGGRDDGEDADEDDEDDDAERRRVRPPSRYYKIQEVIKRRQIMLVQVAKEERGNKGAALTTYLSLAGRYCVLMPNTSRGGGISRKITEVADRKRLKKVLTELEVPDGMAVIVRTAGAGRSRAEIKRDYEYLVRLWSNIRETTLKSTAPTLVYEEASLIKRSIRDLYDRDIEEIIVQGEDEYRIAKEFMKLFITSHAKRVKLYEDTDQPLFHKFGLEEHLESMLHPVVQLRSGGYIVINPTEALVAVDVNSGRSTRERNIEETALRTNMEAADEIARQLRLRDLAGLIVVDFIDMENPRNQGMVERRLKEAMKNDRARVQLGRISPFGLLELSRQRLRPSLLETSFEVCPACSGAGLRPTTESTALAILRRLEEEGIRQRASALSIAVPPAVALYLLNQKRRTLQSIEDRYGIAVAVIADETLVPPEHRVERLKAVEAARAEEETVETIEEEEREEEVEAAPAGEREDPARRSRRRRSRRRRRGDEVGPVHEEALEAAEAEAEEAAEPGEAEEPAVTSGAAEEGESAEEAAERLARRRRRRGKRGGRRRARGPAGQPIEDGEDGEALAAGAAGARFGEGAGFETAEDADFAATGGGVFASAAGETDEHEFAADERDAHDDDEQDARRWEEADEGEPDTEEAAELAALAAFSTDGAPEPVDDDAGEQPRRRRGRSRGRSVAERSDASAGEAFEPATVLVEEAAVEVMEIEEVGGSVPSLPEPDTDAGPEDWQDREDERESPSDADLKTPSFEIEELGGARGTLVDEDLEPDEHPASVAIELTGPLDRVDAPGQGEPALASGHDEGIEAEIGREPEREPAPVPAESAWSVPEWRVPARELEATSAEGHDGQAPGHDGEPWRLPAAPSGDAHEQASFEPAEGAAESATGRGFLPDAGLASAETFAPSETRDESRAEASSASLGWRTPADEALTMAEVGSRPERQSSREGDEAIRAEEARRTEVIRVGEERHVGGGPRRGWWQRLLS